jgi:cytochrome c-type biogenesis protein CcmE
MTEPHSTHDLLNIEAQERKGSSRLVIGLLFFVGVFYLLVNSMMDGGAYFLTVDEVQAAQSKGYLKSGRKVRIKGIVAHGTYINEKGSSEHRFAVQGEQHRVNIYFKGPMPDVFKEGGEVVATGTFTADNLLTATEVTAKCPSKYEQDNISPETRKRMGIGQEQEGM